MSTDERPETYPWVMLNRIKSQEIEIAALRQQHAVKGEGWESINADLRKRLTAMAIQLARVKAVREKWAVLGMPRDFDEVLFDLDEALKDPR